MLVIQPKSVSTARHCFSGCNYVLTLACVAILTLNMRVVQSAEPAGTLVLPRCIVSVKDEAEISAQEPGVLVKLHVREGMRVSEAMALGQIDDEERAVQKQIAEFERAS